MKNVALESSTRLADLWRKERGLLADFVLALAEFDRRRLWAELGYPHLWSYLRRELGLSEALAQSRQIAARLIQRFPQIAGLLRSGRLCITNVVTLADVLTEENCNAVLSQACGLGKSQVERLRATLAPRPPKRNVMHKVAETEALSQRYFRLHLTVTAEFVARLKEAKDALAHKIPDGDTESVLLEGLRLVLAQRDKRRGMTVRPRKPQKAATPRTRQAPAHVRREVWTRDQGRCQWPMGSGICGETRKVELAHIVDHACGGPATAENLILLCAAHNQIDGDRSFGRDFMERCRKRGLQPAEVWEPPESHASP